MDINTKLDGFLVHPLDLFPKTHQAGNTLDNTTANLDGFAVHPIDSFINQKNNTYLNLNNNLINNIKPYPEEGSFTTGLYNQFSKESYEPENQTFNHFNTNTNFVAYTTPSKIYSQYNISPYIEKSNLYQHYPKKISTYYSGANIQKNQKNIFNLKQIQTSTLNNLGGNYKISSPYYLKNNYNIFPANKAMNNGISFNNYPSNNNNLTITKIKSPIFSSIANNIQNSFYPADTTIIRPSKTNYVLPNNQKIIATPKRNEIIPIHRKRIVQRSRTPMASRIYNSLSKNRNIFYTPRKNLAENQSFVHNTSKILSRTNSQIYKLPPRIITAPSIKNNINIISGFQNTSNIHNNIYGRSIYKKNGF